MQALRCVGRGAAVVSRSRVDNGSKRRLTATQQKGAAYQGAVEAVFAILIAGGLGYWADGYFDSAPLYLVIGVVVGFAAFVLRLLRLGGQIEEFSESADQASNSEGGDSRKVSGAGQASKGEESEQSRQGE